MELLRIPCIVGSRAKCVHGHINGQRLKCSQTVHEPLNDAVKWSSNKNDGLVNFGLADKLPNLPPYKGIYPPTVLDPGHSCDYGVYESVTPMLQ